eukprot:1393002-Rhodomonas_salina.1
MDITVHVYAECNAGIPSQLRVGIPTRVCGIGIPRLSREKPAFRAQSLCCRGIPSHTDFPTLELPTSLDLAAWTAQSVRELTGLNGTKTKQNKPDVKERQFEARWQS